MAQVKSVQTNPLHQRVIALDRSKDPFEKQIVEAYGIVQVDIDSVSTYYDEKDAKREQSHGFSPKEEWVLRWLLKRFEEEKSPTIEGPCLNAKAWILLRIVVARLPTTVSARLLSAHKFVAAIERTFQWLFSYVRALELPKLSSEIPLPELSSFSRESSTSATVKGSPHPEDRKSKKKKLNQDGQPAMQRSQKPQRLDVYSLHVSICGVLRQLKARADSSSQELDGFAVEHMKAALKITAEQGSWTFLGIFECLQYELRAMTQNPQTGFNADIYEDLLAPVLYLWGLRSITAIDVKEKTDARCFSRYCFVSAVQLLSLLQKSQTQKPGSVESIRGIETLLADHVISPGREAYLHAKRQDYEGDEAALLMMQELLAPLLLEAQDELELPPVTDNFKSTIAAIPILFSLALKFVHAIAPKQFVSEIPWMQALFAELAKCAYAEFPLTKVGNRDHRCYGLLHDMLQLVKEHHITLNPTVLESIILYVSGLDGSSSEQGVWWTLIGLCIDVGPGSLLLMPGKGAGTSTSSILDKIITKITDLDFATENHIASGHPTALGSFILPLVHHFVHARDLAGFIDIWKQQIIWWEDLRKAKETSGTSLESVESIWEYDILQKTVAENLSTNLTTAQIIRVLQNIGFLHGESLDSAWSNESELCAGLVILDCLIDGFTTDSIVSELRIQLEAISNSILALEDYPTHHGWRIWRILSTLASRRLSGDFFSGSSDLWKKAQTRAQELVINATFKENETSEKPVEYQTALFAFEYVVVATKISRIAGIDERESELMIATVLYIWGYLKRYTHALRESAGTEGRYNGFGPCWSGQRASIISQELFVLACVEYLLSVPQNLSCLPESLLYSFLEPVYFFAYISAESCTTSYPSVWITTLQSGAMAEDVKVANCIRQVLVTDLTQGPRRSLAEEEFVLSCIHRVSPKTWTVIQRNKIFQHISQQLLRKDGTIVPYEGYMIVLANFLPYMKYSISMSLSPSYLWELASVLNSGSQSSGSARGVVVFGELASKYLKLAINNCLERRDFSFWNAFSVNLSVSTNKYDARHYSTLLLHSIAVSEIWSRWSDLPESVRKDLINRPELSQELHDQFAGDLINSKSESANGERDPLLEYLAARLCHMAMNSYQVPEPRHMAVGDREKRLLEILKQVEENVVYEKTRKKHEFATVELTEEDGEARASSRIKNLQQLHSLRARRTWLTYLQESTQMLELEEQADILIEQARYLEKNANDESTLMYVRKMLNRAFGTAGTSAPVMKSAIAKLVSALCNILPRTLSPKCCILAMHALDLTLRKNPWAITQWHIDNLLATITIITSTSGPQMEGDCIDIYTCLTRLLGTVLATHRSKIGGRYHLLLPALQGLLHCLFIPYAYPSSSTAILRRPPWLLTSNLNPEQATMYARLLTSICDPSVSVVTRSKKHARQELNDETKRARDIAGQHLQYLVMEFCQCQLQGRMEPEVRKALNPGLYAIFDAMGQDVRRIINAALDVKGRGIYKMLYEDYRRFGRWDGG